MSSRMEQIIDILIIANISHYPVQKLLLIRMS